MRDARASRTRDEPCPDAPHTAAAAFSGVLRLHVRPSGHGHGELRLWCLMPDTPKPAAHVGDGLSLVGRRLRFTDSRAQERGAEGVVSWSR